jgi:hypothetical protein
MKSTRIVRLILAAMTAASSARANDGVCAKEPRLAGPCFRLHGVMFAANGTPTFRIWRTGTKRILGVLDSEDPAMPKTLHERMLRTGSGFDVRVSADFLVCPYARARKGRMQFVCIERASRVVITPLGRSR